MPNPQPLLTLALLLSLITTPAPAQDPPPATTIDPARLSQRIWRIAKAPSEPAPGSIYIFLPTGTLLQTSCVETYRVARWNIDRSVPRTIRVTEDGRPAFTAEITELTRGTLRLKRKLIRSKETDELAFTAIDKEFVCPDLPK